MKRFLAAALLLTLLSTGVCYGVNLTSTATAESNTVSVSLDTIQQLWMDHSLDYAKLQSDLAVSKKTYSEVSKSLDRADENGLDSLLNSLLNSRDQAKLAYDVASAQYDQKVQNGILSAKTAFLTCWQDQLNLDTARKTLAQKQDQLSRDTEALRRGYLSQNTYDTLKDAADELQNTVNSLSTKQDLDETALKTKLGLSLDDTIIYIFPDLSREVFADLMAKVDPSADFTALQANSVNLKVLLITADSLSVYIRSYANSAQVDNAKLNLKNAQDTLQASFTAQYQSLINQYTDLQNEYRKLSVEKDQLDKTQKQFDKGYVSTLALSNLNLEYSSMETGVKVKESALYSAYLSYLNMVAGN